MPPARKPIKEAKATGTYDHNRQRYADRSGLNFGRHEQPLGDPPSHFDLVEAHCWHEIREQMEWLRASDRTVCEMACMLKAKLRMRALPHASYGILKGLMIELGGRSGPKNQERKIPEKAGEVDEFGL